MAADCGVGLIENGHAEAATMHIDGGWWRRAALIILEACDDDDTHAQVETHKFSAISCWQ